MDPSQRPQSEVGVAGGRVAAKRGSPMDAGEFRAWATRAGMEPPDRLSLALKTLWHLARGEWDAAHRCAQSRNDRDGAWVHAHVHRVEGDSASPVRAISRRRGPSARARTADPGRRTRTAGGRPHPATSRVPDRPMRKCRRPVPSWRSGIRAQAGPLSGGSCIRRSSSRTGIPSNSAAFGSEMAPSARARRHSRSNRLGFSPSRIARGSS